VSGPSKVDLQRGLARCREEREALAAKVADLEVRLAAGEAAQIEAEQSLAAIRAAWASAEAEDLRALVEAFPGVAPELRELMGP
jgi:phosphoserine phosphatase